MADSYLTFDGVTGTVTVLNDAALNVGAGDFSICFWGKDIFTEATNILDKMNSNTGYRIYYLPTEQVIEILTGSGFLATIANFALSLNTSGWQHIVFTRNSTTIKGYLNAVEQTISGSADGNNLDNTGDFIISFPAVYLLGSLDDIRIYKSVLSLADVQEIYNGGIGKKYAQLASLKDASWASNVDEGVNPLVLYDDVGTNDGTLVDGVTWSTGGVPFSSGGGLVAVPAMKENWGW